VPLNSLRFKEIARFDAKIFENLPAVRKNRELRPEIKYHRREKAIETLLVFG